MTGSNNRDLTAEISRPHSAVNYSKDFFETYRDGSLRSARAVVPIILSYVPSRSVCDVGCGVGTWLRAFKEAGVAEIQGFDGDYVDRAMLQIPAESFSPADLAVPLKVSRQFDLAISVEVAEHLPDTVARSFVSSVASLAPAIAFSAAIPGQGGHGHINEQWPSYWAKLFLEQGYIAVDCLRPQIWDNEDIEFFYRQNILLYVKETQLRAYPGLAEAAKRMAGLPLDTVHPRQHAKDLARRPEEYLLDTLAKLPRLFKKAVARRMP